MTLDPVDVTVRLPEWLGFHYDAFRASLSAL